MPVSVIIPTLNEALSIADTLFLLRGQKPHEIIVADGGSTDETLTRAQGADRIFSGPRGRAAQMNQGAGYATGDVLLFLHADCSLEEGALAAAERALDRPNISAGCFAMTIRDQSLIYRAIDRCATLRTRLTGLIYGDQGMFLKRRVFQEIGGFPNVDFMEDISISRRLHGHGRVMVVPERIFVSARRWRQRGVVRQTLLNWALTGLAALGIPPANLRRFYPEAR